MGLDYKKCAAEIVASAGGEANIISVSHCMTRLRFNLTDAKKIDLEAIKKIKGVMGALYATEQLQVIMGANLLPVFEEIVKQNHFRVDEAVDENLDCVEEKKKLTFKSFGSAAFSYVSAAVTPLIPGIIAGGMLKVVLLLINLANPSFGATATYKMLGWIANAPFYFMAIFVAYGATKKLGSTPIYTMAVTAAMLTPDWAAMVKAGEPVSLVGLPVHLVTYANSLLPALIIALLAYYVEKFFNKIVPGIFKSLLVGLGTMIVTGICAFVFIGPVGSILGVYMVNFFVWLSEVVGPIALGLLAALLPWIIMSDMATVLGPVMVQSLATVGFDGLFRPALLVHNMAEGGACLGVALRAKDKEFKSQCLSIAFGCIVAGVSEPAIYGVHLKLKKPMYGVMAGGAAGGIVAGIFGVKAFIMGYSTILALPIFLDTMMGMLIAVITAIVVAAVVAYVLGFDQNDAKI